jgi:hypothetical protein
MALIPVYKGDQYYARGPLRDVRINTKENSLWGKINVKDNEEWVDTFFWKDSKFLIWEER